MLRQFHSYTLIAQVSSSDVGATYRAIDKDHAREVMVKIGQAGESELRTGAARATQLDPPGFALYCDAGVTPDGEPYLVEYPVAGRPLADIVRRYEGDWRQIAHLIREVAIALVRAHECGLTHGDICVHSIMVGDDGLPVLTQFGMGLATGSPDDDDPQAEARRQKRYIRADLFATGFVMYHLLSGDAPSRTHPSRLSDPAAGGDDIAPIDRTAPEAPPELRAICAQALSTDPVHRYTAAVRLVRDLESYLYGKRRRPTVRIALVVLAALTVGLFGLWGTVGGGPARIGAVGVWALPADAGAPATPMGHDSEALTVDDRVQVSVGLSKAGQVSVIYRAPDGTVRTVARGVRIDGRGARRIPADGTGWSPGTTGGAGIVMIAANPDTGRFESIMAAALAEAGQPPVSLAPMVIYADALPAPVDPPLLGAAADRRPMRWKNAADFVKFIKRRTARVCDDCAIVLLYVVGP